MQKSVFALLLIFYWRKIETFEISLMMFVFRDHKLRFHCGRSSYSSLKAFESNESTVWDIVEISLNSVLFLRRIAKRVCWTFTFLKGSPFTPIYSFLDSNMSHPFLMFIWFLHNFTLFQQMSHLCHYFMFLKNCKRSILDKVCESAIKSPELKESNILFFLASTTENEI